MPPILSRVLFYFLFLVKPLYHVLRSAEIEKEVVVNINTLHAWSLGSPFKYVEFRTHLISHLRGICSTLDVRTYRHVVQLICEFKMAYVDQVIENMKTIRAAIDYQFGHSTKVNPLTIDL